MLRLRPFKNSDAEEIVNWTSEEQEFYKWSAGLFGPFPLTQERLLESIYKEENYERFFPFTAFDENGLVGFLILRIPGDDDKRLRVAYVIINPAKRNMGYGKRMVQLSLDFAFNVYGANVACLGVFANNVNAHKCYEKLGFKESGDHVNFEVNGEIWETIEMEIRQ